MLKERRKKHWKIVFGPLKLNDLPLGEFRALTQEELDALKG